MSCNYQFDQSASTSLREQALKPSRKSKIANLKFRIPVAFAILLFVCTTCYGRAARVVVVKVDGLPPAVVDRFVRERDSRTGKSKLPWIEHIFYQRGTRLENFYVRGMSLSAPSWSLLDTGQHLQIKGNVEYDRFTLHTYDYLNFIPFYVDYLRSLRVDMPGPEVLDDLRIPLLEDAFPYDERLQSFQLFQRGVRWTTLQNAALNPVTTRSPRELFDEWVTGFEARNLIPEQSERDLVKKLQDSRIRYLDYYSTEFDHAAHGNRELDAQAEAIKRIDESIGRIWIAIQKTPEAADTALVLISDHGINSDPKIYSQGFNLVKLLGSRAGGAHHVVTKRRLLLDYSLKGVYPLVPLIHSTSEDSYYLQGQSTTYPTALLDFDGNERAAMHLRDGDLNELHILLQQLQTGRLKPEVARAATAAFVSIIDRRRPDWSQTLRELNEELAALRNEIAKTEKIVATFPKKWTKEDEDTGRDKVARRIAASLRRMIADEQNYTAYARTLARLLELGGASFDPKRIRIKDVIPPNSMGESNSLHELQNYTVGIANSGLSLAPDGTLDHERSFVHVNYFALLQSAEVRNNVQAGVSNHPTDFVAVRVPIESLDVTGTNGDGQSQDIGDMRAEAAVLLYGGAFRQALVLGRRNSQGELELRYIPVKHLTQDAEGKTHFESAEWGNGLPLKMWEDAKLRLPDGVTSNDKAMRATWLAAWHTDLEWLRALHETFYSNALVGVHEQFAIHTVDALRPDESGVSEDERLMRRFRLRQRKLVETDLFVHANNHWNFDVRGFNPGGNHGSFYRISTHSTLMFAGGARTGIEQGRVVEEPYDSLSFVPTVLALTSSSPSRNLPVSWQKEASRLPGRVIGEVVKDIPRTHELPNTGEATAP